MRAVIKGRYSWTEYEIGKTSNPTAANISKSPNEKAIANLIARKYAAVAGAKGSSFTRMIELR
jgi:hypothetical protein